MECHAKQQFYSHLSKQMFLEAHHKLDIFITYDKLRHPMMLNPHIKNNFIESKVVVIVLIGAIFTNLENQLITMRMASIPFHSSSWAMKPMGILSCGSFGIGRNMYGLFFFLYVDFMFWHLTNVRMKCSTSYFIPAQ
jgi:hypothetical protein